MVATLPGVRSVPGNLQAVPAENSSLDFDPIDRAGNLWAEHWPDEDESVYAAMRAVTSIMRAHQILIAELDGLLSQAVKLRS